jgi:hypothetical protein
VKSRNMPADIKPPLTPEDRALLEGMAGWLGRRNLTVPAVLFLESVKPLHFIGSQMLVFFEPMVHAFTGGKNYSRFAQLMEDGDALEQFLVMIEGAGAKKA